MSAERFVELYERYHHDVVRFVARRCGPCRADDVAHEVFVTAWQRNEDLPASNDRALAWLYAVARNHLLHEFRSEGRRSALAVRIAREYRDQPSHAGAVAQTVDLARAWDALPAQEQEALALIGWEQLTVASAALVLGISQRTFARRLARARRLLRASLDLTEEHAAQPAPVRVAPTPSPTTPASLSLACPAPALTCPD